MLSGAPGSGKTVVAAGLRAALPGVVVVDLDHFLDAGSRLAGVDLWQDSAADRWPAYNDLCLTLVSTVLAAGRDLLLLSPLTPDEVRQSTAAPALGEVHGAVLDCSDATRIARFRSRSNASAADAPADAAELRALELPVIRNDDIGIGAAAQLIAGWAHARLHT